MSLVELETLHLSRHAFSPRDAARAGDIWRLYQDAAILGSAHLGWHPARYRAEGCAFVMRKMTAVHDRELAFGEDLRVRTWVSTFRGGRFSNRQVRIEVGGEVVSRTTQEWLHVKTPEMRIARAAPSLVEVFELHDLGPDVALPEVVSPGEGEVRVFEFDAWNTWMDPLAHANHPLYVDWVDEAVARLARAAGLDPHGVIPVAESVSWRSGVEAGDRVRVETRCVGRTARGGVVCTHRYLVGEREAASAVTVRDHTSGGEALAAAL